MNLLIINSLLHSIEYNYFKSLKKDIKKQKQKKIDNRNKFSRNIKLYFVILKNISDLNSLIQYKYRLNKIVLKLFY